MISELLRTCIFINFHVINSINGNKSVKININNSDFFLTTAEYYIITLTLPMCLLCPLTMSSQISALI